MMAATLGKLFKNVFEKEWGNLKHELISLQK